MKKKILFVINSLGCGGAEKALLSLLTLIDREKYEIYLQIFARGGMFENLLPPEINILPPLDYTAFCNKSLAAQIFSFDIKRITARIKTVTELRKNAQQGHPLHDAQAYWKYSAKAYNTLPQQYDIAIAWGQGTPTHFVAQKTKAKKKFAWVNVNYEDAGHNKDFDRNIYAEYTGIVCVSNKLRDIFVNVYPEYSQKCSVILDIQNAALIAKMAQDECSLHKQGLTITTVGRLVRQKGYDIAAEAAYILKKRGFTFKWFIVGGGDASLIEKDIATYDIGDCFILLGAKSNPYPYIAAADIYVQTSKYEGYCLTLAEARMLNIPCVTTAFDVVYEQMINGENGLVVDINAQAVADGIIRLTTDKELYEHIKCYLEHEKKGNVEEIEKVYSILE